MRATLWLFVVALGLLQTVQAQAQPQAEVPWSALATTRVATEERRFTSGEAELSGTLQVPLSTGPVAAIVVAHSASSPLGSALLYDHLKTMLPALGIAVFTYDRRGSGKSGNKDAGGSFTLLADDAAAAVRSLKADPRIDPQRIGIWGLSQGGWIAPLAASRSGDVAFVVSVAGPAVTADVQMMFSSTNHLKVHGYAQADINQMVATRKAVDDYMRGTGTKDAAQCMVDMAKSKPWFKYLYMGETVRDRTVSGWRKEIENDPLKNVSAVRVPMLILYGANDAVVPVATSVERLKSVAQLRPKMRVHVVAGADHAMQMSVDEATSLDPKRDGTEQPDSPEYIAVLTAWLVEQGLAWRSTAY